MGIIDPVNFLLKKRNSCHAACDMALQFTPHLPALMHAHAAYEAAVLGAPHVEDPIRPSTHNEVAKLVDEFIRLLGTDLTTPTADNPFWHTGQPVPLAAGEYKTRRPWEWVWLVAQGRAFGKGWPYTEDPALTLLPALQPAVVRHDQRGFVERSGCGPWPAGRGCESDAQFA